MSATNVSATNVSAANASATNASATNASATNASATATSATNASATNASATNVSVTNASATNASATNISATTTSATNASATNVSATNFSATNASATNVSATTTSVAIVSATTRKRIDCMFTVFIRIPYVNGYRLLSIPALSDTLVSELRAHIPLPHDFRLSFCGRTLYDDCTLSSYNIQRDSTLLLSCPLLGGSKFSCRIGVTDDILPFISNHSLFDNLLLCTMWETETDMGFPDKLTLEADIFSKPENFGFSGKLIREYKHFSIFIRDPVHGFLYKNEVIDPSSFTSLRLFVSMLGFVDILFVGAVKREREEPTEVVKRHKVEREAFTYFGADLTLPIPLNDPIPLHSYNFISSWRMPQDFVCKLLKTILIPPHFVLNNPQIVCDIRTYIRKNENDCVEISRDIPFYSFVSPFAPVSVNFFFEKLQLGLKGMKKGYKAFLYSVSDNAVEMTHPLANYFFQQNASPYVPPDAVGTLYVYDVVDPPFLRHLEALEDES
jgi:hypothetical protein